MEISLNKAQQQAVEHDSGPLLIIAGAGTGKTAVITKRIIHLIDSGLAKPSEILALTFTEKAASEMVERIDQHMPIGYDEIAISTFHSFCDSILRESALHIGVDINYKIMSQAQSYIFFRKHLFDFPLDNLRPLGNPTSFIGAILKHFSKLQDEDVTPDDYINFVESIKASGKYSDDEVTQFRELSQTFKIYTELKIRNSNFDFSDLISFTLKLFREREHILEQYRKRFKYILVDEFQDTNFTQNQLVNMIVLGSDVEKASADQRKKANLTVVGDDDQSIYKFRGAAISNIMQFKEVYPNSKKVVLTENYRSRQEILDSAYKVIQNNNPNRLEVEEGINKRLLSMGKFSETNSSAVSLVVKDSGEHEADFIAKEILKLTGNKDRLKNDSSIVDEQYSPQGQGMFVDMDNSTSSSIKFGDVAVLARANSHLDQVIQALKYYGIPFKFSGPKGLYLRPEIQNLIAFLKVVADLTDDLSMFKLIKMDIFKLSPREIVDLMQYAKQQKISIFESLEQLWGISRNVEISENDLQPTMFEADPKELSNHVKSMFSQEGIASLTNLLTLFNSAFTQIKEGFSVGEILYSFFKDSGYLQMLLSHDDYESQFQIQNISKYFTLIKQYEEASEGARVIDYVDYLNYSIEIGENPKADEDALEDYDAVNLLTVHSSKGLEFPIVFMCNMAQGRFPGRAMSDPLKLPEELVKEIVPEGSDESLEKMQEERRLFYVGVTRAKEKLYFTSAKRYGDAKRDKKLSPFIYELFGESIDNLDSKGAKSKYNQAAPGFAIQVSSYDDSLDISGLGINEIEKVSYSHVSTYETCPKQYKFRYLLGVPTGDNPTLSFGKSIHSTLQAFYKNKITGVDTDLDGIKEIYKNSWIVDGYESKKHEQLRFKYGIKVLEGFYNDYILKSEVSPILLEKWFKYKVNDIFVSGSIDRIDKVGFEDGKTVVELIDYKTGKVKDEKEVKNDLQLAIYALVAEELLGYKVQRASLLFVEHGVKLDVNLTEELKKVAKETLLDVVAKVRAGELAATPGFHCKWCDYKLICEDAEI